MKTGIAAIAGAAFIALAGFATAQTMPGSPAAGHAMDSHDATMSDMSGMHEMHRHGATSAAVPTEPGQGAFGAIQEIVRILETDPKTDWSKVDLEALRQHLIDMNEVTLRAAATERPIEGGAEFAVTGRGRTLVAIRRMVTAQAQMLNGRNGWAAKSAPLADGVLLTVTTQNPGEVAHIRGLGFIGLMATGSYHPQHHLAMALGERMVH
ncbi:MAG TPA: hypothetical protein VN668_10800 [Stellaceae bacterium]|nr:hypothetical protein [Stellaceae bacterium]